MKANRHSLHQKTPLLIHRPGRVTRSSNAGCNIFLTRNNNKIAYSMGRGNAQRPCDVYLPEKQAGVEHLILAPVQASNAWRIRCTSTMRTEVNGVPIQSASVCRQGGPKRLPCAVYLRQNLINCISTNGVRIDVWLLKTPMEAFPTEDIVTKSVDNYFADRSEPWARRELFLLGEQVSRNSHRVVHRFTGAVSTAKVFRDGPYRWQKRAQEFAKFGKEQVDASIVRYHAMVEIDNMPAVLTDTHKGLQTYAALLSDIKTLHMGSRFLIAAKLQRRLFSALDFLHFHGIIHGAVTNDSVLLRLAGRQAQTVLLVNYSATTSVTAGTELPRSHTLEDGRAAMEIVADCCDIWHVRQAAARNAEDERFMAGKTSTAREELDLVKRVIADFHQRDGRKRSRKGKRLLRLVELKQQVYERCRADQERNATRREFGVCLQESIDEAVEDWARAHAAFRVGETAWMHLSLGHPYLDNLANELHHGRWDTTPREVCAQFKSLAGEIEEPWQTLAVEKPLTFRRSGKDIAEPCVLRWIASCCESYPEWRPALETEYNGHVRPRAGLIRAKSLRKLRNALSSHGHLPASISGTFVALLTPKAQGQSTIHTKAAHRVMQHLPSRMFNLTQLQRLANPDNFIACVESREHGCDNYVEVRGEPSLQGCYAPIALLAHFASRLGLSLPDAPPVPHALLPAHDPADFSQVPTGRIVLVRTGLVGFASVVRSGDQCDWHAPRKPQNPETIHSFLATYFGNMKVLPRLPDHVHEHLRPTHWSAFQTAEALETAADLGRRRVRKPVGQRLQTQRSHSLSDVVSAPLESTSLDTEQPPLVCMLKQRERRRAEARPPATKHVQAGAPVWSTAKRTRTSNIPESITPSYPTSAVTMSFVARAAQRMESPPSHPTTPGNLLARNTPCLRNNTAASRTPLPNPPARFSLDTDFTVQDGEFDLQADWHKAEELLAQMPRTHRPANNNNSEDDDDDGLEHHLLGFRIHGHDPPGSTVSAAEPSDADSAEASEPDSVSNGQKLGNKAADFRPGVLNIPWATAKGNAASVPPGQAFGLPTPEVADWIHSLP